MKQFRLIAPFIMITAIISLIRAAEHRCPQWQRDEKAAIRLATERDVPLLVFVTSPACAYCDAQKAAFCDRKLSAQLERDFVPLTLDAAGNEALMRRLGVEAFPTTLVLAPDSRILARLVGYRKPEQMSQALDTSHREYQKQKKIAMNAGNSSHGAD